MKLETRIKNFYNAMQKQLIKRSFLLALGEGIYISLVALQ